MDDDEAASHSTTATATTNNKRSSSLDASNTAIGGGLSVNSYLGIKNSWSKSFGQIKLNQSLDALCIFLILCFCSSSWF